MPLVGDGRRWATGAILLLGMLTCVQGSAVDRRTMSLFGVFGGLAVVFAVLASAMSGTLRGGRSQPRMTTFRGRRSTQSS